MTQTRLFVSLRSTLKMELARGREVPTILISFTSITMATVSFAPMVVRTGPMRRARLLCKKEFGKAMKFKEFVIAI